MAWRADKDGWRKMPNGKSIFMYKGETVSEAFTRIDKEKEINKNSSEQNHYEYLKQTKFNNLDEYDEQILYDNNKDKNKPQTINDLTNDVNILEKMTEGPILKERHILNIHSLINKKLNDIQSQMNYMKIHKMENSNLYKQLEELSRRLKDARSNLNDM